jgi:putative colanic acid biosynthesis glycosyltransferase
VGSPWLTVVTVVKDDFEGLQLTLQSLTAQDLTGVQHLVVDSSSNSDEVSGALTNSVSEYTWVTPAGVYAAMNTGLSEAKGKYVYYLNAGDRLYAPATLSMLRAQLDEHQPRWVFGPVEILSMDGTRTITPPWNYEREAAIGFSRGFFPAHQGTVVKRSVLKELGGFDTSYRIAADYTMVLRLTTVGGPLQLDFPLARFAEGGISTVEWKQSLREFHRARMEVWAPEGVAALRERWETIFHFTRMWIARDVLRRGRP